MLAFTSHSRLWACSLWSRRQSALIGRSVVERPLIERHISMLFSLGVGVQFSSLMVVPLLSRVGLFARYGRRVVV